jgi:hypothetical protein
MLTEEEVQHFRAALRNAARACGGMPVLAGAVGVPVGTVQYRVRIAREELEAALVRRRASERWAARARQVA